MVRTLFFHLRKPGFKSSCCRLAVLFTTCCFINEYLAIDSGGYVNE